MVRIFDVVIVGAGPVGLFGVFSAGLLGMNCCVIDNLERIGGQCNALYPDKPIYDIPGFPKVSGRDLVSNLEEQARRYKPHFVLGSLVSNVVRNSDGIFEVSTDKQETLYAKAVIIAAGNGVIREKRLEVLGADVCEGNTLMYRVQDVKLLSGKRILVVGGGDSAADWAIMLSDVAESLYLVHRRDKFTCHPASENKVRDLVAIRKIKLMVGYQVARLYADTLGHLQKVALRRISDGTQEEVDVDYVLPFLGLGMELSFVKRWNILCSRSGRILVDQETMATNLKGVYAAGDIAEYAGKLKLILTGFAEITRACYSAYSSVFVGKALHFTYSTQKIGGDG